MGAIATTVGTSRQSLHTEFGTKEDLGHALVMRETTAFFDGVSERLHAHDDFAAAVQSAALFTLRAAERNPLLQAALAGTRASENTGLLPLLTSRSEPLLVAGAELFGGWLARRAPDLPPVTARILVNSASRLIISHAVAPTQEPDEAAHDIAQLVCLLAGVDSDVVRR